MDGFSWRIGVDEAGYGPNLGPLVVAATAWRTPAVGDLYDLLAKAVIPTATSDGRLLIADSKAVYSPGGGLGQLERAVYAALGRPICWSELVAGLGADPDGARGELPWHEGFDPSLPVDADTVDVDAAGARLSEAAQQAEVGSIQLAARLVFPAEFNRLVDEHGTKGAALSHISIGLARRLYDECAGADSACEITFDKHGGRNRYGALLHEHFHEGWIEAVEESRPISRYRSGERLRFAFRTKGEGELPVALASMTAKLLRELSMAAFNAYWAAQFPGIKPTAGYPVDAKRFKAEITARQAEIGVPDATLWRNR